MDNRKFLVVMTLRGIAAISISNAIAVDAPSKRQYDQTTLTQVEGLYGLSEVAAVARLAKEYDAAVQARHIEHLHFAGYAGSWFDSATQRLQVATTDPADFKAIERVGAAPILVNRSLKELEAGRNDLSDAVRADVSGESVRESYVDVKTNTVVLGISADAIAQVSAFIATLANRNVPVRLIMASSNVGFSSNLLGADGTQNGTWHTTRGGVYPCSVGASAEKVSGSSYVSGFATAGHCNSVNDVIWSSSGVSIGQVDWSTFNISTYAFSNNEDGAWVRAYSGWAPQPQVNGYSDPTQNVSGTWAGLLDAPVGTTACRYGEASGGPHCGSISARNVTACLDYCIPPYPPYPINIQGLIKINGICTNDGDSGGTLITPSGQVQGTVTGGTRNSCPDSVGDYVYFQPITTTLNRASSDLSSPIVLLTLHGRSAPTASLFRCPDPANSGSYNGYHVYACDFVDYDSQGPTTMLWTTSTGASSNSLEVYDNCTVPGPLVTVTLALTNLYGTTYKTGSFSCPTKPIP